MEKDLEFLVLSVVHRLSLRGGHLDQEVQTVVTGDCAQEAARVLDHASIASDEDLQRLPALTCRTQHVIASGLGKHVHARGHLRNSPLACSLVSLTTRWP
ncbi:MAG: hypothetical protein AMK75_05065 [Planctomycetes bacterium SM23_65]|nr:MAG: hypothetical protein AMK75_05065 [Planctomycetes bacterium SM23_65]